MIWLQSVVGIDILRVGHDYKVLVHHLRKRGLVARPHRRISVTQAEATVVIIPVVDLGNLDLPYHGQEGAISITSDGGVLACIVTVDERTSITDSQFFHVLDDDVVEGPRLRPEDVRKTVDQLGPGLVDPGLETMIDPSALSVFAHRALSSDVEARLVHPQLDYAALFSASNDEFLAGISREAFGQIRGGNLRALPGCSTSTSTSCTGCSSSSTSSASSPAGQSGRAKGYLECITSVHYLTMREAQALSPAGLTTAVQ